MLIKQSKKRNHYLHLEQVLEANDIVLLTAGTSVGKTYVTDLLLQHHPEVFRPMTYTTRPPRTDQADSHTCQYVTHEQYMALPDLIMRVQYPPLTGFWYGYRASDIHQALAHHKKLVIIVTSDSKDRYLRWFQEHYPSHSIKSIFWYIPEEEQTARYCHRIGAATPTDLPKLISNYTPEKIAHASAPLFQKYALTPPQQYAILNALSKKSHFNNTKDTLSYFSQALYNRSANEITSYEQGTIIKLITDLNALTATFPKNQASLEDLTERLQNNKNDWHYHYDYIINATKSINNKDVQYHPQHKEKEK